MPKKDVVLAERLLIEADLAADNADDRELDYKKVLKCYDKAIKASPKGDLIIPRINASKAFYLARVAIGSDNDKEQQKLMKEAAKFAVLGTKDQDNLLGKYVASRIQLRQEQISQEDALKIAEEVKLATPITWTDHLAQVSAIHITDGIEAKIAKLQKITQMPGFKDDYRPYAILGADSNYYRTTLGDMKTFLEYLEIARNAYYKAAGLEQGFYRSYAEIADIASVQCENIPDMAKEKDEEELAALLKYGEGRKAAGLKYDPRYFSDLGYVYTELGRDSEALEIAKQYVKSFPKSGSAHSALGKKLSMQAYTTEAEKEAALKESMKSFDKATKLEPGRVYHYAIKGVALSNFGDIEGAIESLKTAKLLANTKRAQKYAAEHPEVQDFVHRMMTEEYDAMVQQLEMLEAKRVEVAAASVTDDEYTKEAVQEIDKNVLNAAKKQVALMGDNANATPEEQDLATQSVEYAVRMSDVHVKFMTLKATPKIGEFVHSLAHTISASYNTALALSGGHANLKTGSWMSGLIAFTALAPVGGAVIAKIGEKVANTVSERRQEKKYAGLSAYFATPYECSLFAELVSVAISDKLQARIDSFDNAPVKSKEITGETGLLSRMISGCKKLMEKGKEVVVGKDYVHKTPLALYGHQLAGDLMSEMMSRDGEIEVQPVFTRDLRAAEYIVKQETESTASKSSSGPLAGFSAVLGELGEVIESIGEMV